MAVTKIARVGDKKLQIKLIKKLSSVISSRWLMVSSISNEVNMLTPNSCACQQVCNIGNADIATQYVVAANGEGNLVIPAINSTWATSQLLIMVPTNVAATAAKGSRLKNDSTQNTNPMRTRIIVLIGLVCAMFCKKYFIEYC